LTSEENKILIVEDEPDTADLFAEMVQIIGHPVVKVNGYGAAIEQMKREVPLAVILDIMMPDLSGLEVLRYIRGDPSLRDTPVVIVSALGMLSDVRNAKEAGANAYLTKPVSFKEMKSVLQGAIGSGVQD
jgi:CheY-like chemotaxis protein